MESLDLQLVRWAIEQLVAAQRLEGDPAQASAKEKVQQSVAAAVKLIGIKLPAGGSLEEMMAPLLDVVAQRGEGDGSRFVERSMESISVFTSDRGMLCVSQENSGGEGRVVLIHPNQLDVVINWLRMEREDVMQGWEEGAFFDDAEASVEEDPEAPSDGPDET